MSTRQGRSPWLYQEAVEDFLQRLRNSDRHTVADRAAAREIEADARVPDMTLEEAALLERVVNGGTVYKQEILHALNTMTEALGFLNQGEEYCMESVTDAFLDHLDRAREALRNPQTAAQFAQRRH